MKKVYDRDGKEKGIFRKLDEIKDCWQKRTLESFVNAGCVLFETSPGQYGAIPAAFVTIKEAGE